MAGDFEVDAPKKQQAMRDAAAPVKRSVGGTRAPSPQIGVLVRYANGRKEEAINAVFDAFSDGAGVLVKVAAKGVSRRYKRPEDFPKNNSWVGGGEGRGLMYVKYECLD